jgi:hypothetical protein
MPKPLFNADNHTYTTTDGRKLVGVTTVLGEYRRVSYAGREFYVDQAGNVIDADVMRNAADFGSAVHKCLEYALTVGPNGFSYPDVIAPCVDQIWKWVQDYNPGVLSVEEQLYSERYMVAGTLDIMCRINGRLCLVDAKTGDGKMTGPQTAAYEVLWREDTGSKEPIDRYLLRLPRDGGDYKFKALTNPQDWNFFKAKLFCANYLKGV